MITINTIIINTRISKSVPDFAKCNGQPDGQTDGHNDDNTPSDSRAKGKSHKL